MKEMNLFHKALAVAMIALTLVGLAGHWFHVGPAARWSGNANGGYVDLGVDR